MTGSTLGHLLDPQEVGRDKGVGNEAPAMPVDADQINFAMTESGAERSCRLKHMRQHRAARQRMHDLGQVRAHAFAHAGCQHHNIQNDCFVVQDPILGRYHRGHEEKTGGNLNRSIARAPCCTDGLLLR